MVYRVLADIVVLVHFLFILLVIFGGFLVLKRRWFALVHLPAALWGVLIEWSGGVCPLTPLENSLRIKGGEAGYSTSFVEHYLLPIIYPAGLTRSVQIILGASVLLLNLGIYGWILRARRRGRVARKRDSG